MKALFNLKRKQCSSKGNANIYVYTSQIIDKYILHIHEILHDTKAWNQSTDMHVSLVSSNEQQWTIKMAITFFLFSLFKESVWGIIILIFPCLCYIG